MDCQSCNCSAGVLTGVRCVSRLAVAPCRDPARKRTRRSAKHSRARHPCHWIAPASGKNDKNNACFVCGRTFVRAVLTPKTSLQREWSRLGPKTQPQLCRPIVRPIPATSKPLWPSGTWTFASSVLPHKVTDDEFVCRPVFRKCEKPRLNAGVCRPFLVRLAAVLMLWCGGSVVLGWWSRFAVGVGWLARGTSH